MEKNRIISFNGSLTNLTELNVKENELETLGANMPNIEVLKISENRIYDLSHLYKYTSLVELWASDNPYASIKGISSLRKLELLDIRTTKVSDVTELQQIETFNSIYLSEEFDHSQVEFLRGRFKKADTYTKKYLLTEK